jgi:hypothetical protein
MRSTALLAAFGVLVTGACGEQVGCACSRTAARARPRSAARELARRSGRAVAGARALLVRRRGNTFDLSVDTGSSRLHAARRSGAPIRDRSRPIPDRATRVRYVGCVSDFFIAGRWRNRDQLRAVVDVVRASGKTAYCFIEHDYEVDGVKIDGDADPEGFMRQTEALHHDDPLIRRIFEADLAAERAADHFLLVLPAGLAGHIEAGIAYGMGKPCYVLGTPEKTETLYCIFTQIFSDLRARGLADVPGGVARLAGWREAHDSIRPLRGPRCSTPRASRHDVHVVSATAVA